MNRSAEAEVAILQARLFVKDTKVKALEQTIREVRLFLEEQAELGGSAKLEGQLICSALLGKLNGEVNV